MSLETSQNHPLFEIVTTTMGAVSIRNKEVNEIMHNPVGPWREANELYIEQSRLSERMDRDLEKELVVFDVGLGAAANALAVLHCAKAKKRPLRLISFEVDLELLKFALAHSSQFAHFSGYEKAIETLLRQKHWQDSHIHWELEQGDFLDKIQNVNHHADIVYYDPYSSKVNPEMWTTPCFKKLREKCKDRALFFNYSQATPIRAALLEAGFYVGYGIPTGEKKATTQAACSLKDLEKPLDSRWLLRWKRSRSPFPIQCSNKKEFFDSIFNHKQFEGIPFYRC